MRGAELISTQKRQLTTPKFPVFEDVRTVVARDGAVYQVVRTTVYYAPELVSKSYSSTFLGRLETADSPDIRKP